MLCLTQLANLERSLQKWLSHGKFWRSSAWISEESGETNAARCEMNSQQCSTAVRRRESSPGGRIFNFQNGRKSLCRAVGFGTSDENDRDEAGIQLSRRVGDEEEDD